MSVSCSSFLVAVSKLFRNAGFIYCLSCFCKRFLQMSNSPRMTRLACAGKTDAVKYTFLPLCSRDVGTRFLLLSHTFVASSPTPAVTILSCRGVVTVHVCLMKLVNGVATGSNWHFCWRPLPTDGDLNRLWSQHSTVLQKWQRTETRWQVSLRKGDATISWSIKNRLLFPKLWSPQPFSKLWVWETILDPVGWVICVVTGVVCPQFLLGSPD